MSNYRLIPLIIMAGLLSSFSGELTAQAKAEGWKLLFDGKTTAGWHKYKTAPFPAKGWTVEEGWLHGLGKGGGDIISDAQFDQFDLRWEWRLPEGGNSGVKYFVTPTRSSALGHEYQMFHDKNKAADAEPGIHSTASFYDVLKPYTKPPVKPPGQINESRILVKGNHVEHWLNGVKVLDYECGSESVKTAVAQSKFKNTPDFGTRIKGHILLQDHGSDVWFRNIRILDLSGGSK